jgi:hypothetical protein
MSREQGPRLQTGDATVRDCRRTLTVPGLEPGQWIGGGGMISLCRSLGVLGWPCSAVWHRPRAFPARPSLLLCPDRASGPARQLTAGPHLRR